MRTDARSHSREEPMLETMLLRRPAGFALPIGTDSHQLHRTDLYAGAPGGTA